MVSINTVVNPFDNQSSWSDGVNTSLNQEEAYATERLDDGSYVLAVKNTNNYNENIDTNWAIYKVDNTGVLDWNASWGSASHYELQFGQDLNQDGILGRNSQLNKISSDTTGSELEEIMMSFISMRTVMTQQQMTCLLPINTAELLILIIQPNGQTESKQPSGLKKLLRSSNKAMGPIAWQSKNKYIQWND